MNSGKIRTSNKYIKDNDLRQKYVTVADFNDLWDDVQAVENIALNSSVPPELIDDVEDLDSRVTQLEEDMNNLPEIVEGLIVDKGLGNLSIVCYGMPCQTRIVHDTNISAQDFAIIYFTDVCRKVHYTGNEQLTYHLDCDSPWVDKTHATNTDPDQCYLKFNCNHLGMQDIEVWVTSPSIDVKHNINVYATIFDNAGYCSM